jgi:FkbM family methyltransferase
MAALKSALKRLRVSQPFNVIATSSVRFFLGNLGLRPELVIKHLHRVGVVRCDLPNGRQLLLWSRADDWISNQLYWRGWLGYEPETLPLFFRLATRAQVTVDVGSYVGLFTLVAAHANPKGRVYAFEPMKSIYKRLLRNVSLNRLSNVQCVPKAVGETDSIAEFFHVAAELPSSSSLSFEFMSSAKDLVSSAVEVVTLDRFARESGLGHVDLVKVDTESTEPEVLRGMLGILRSSHPFILCEVLPGRGAEEPLEEILRQLGYRFYHLTPQGPVLRDHVKGHPEWLNYLFTTLDAEQVAAL